MDQHLEEAGLLFNPIQAGFTCPKCGGALTTPDAGGQLVLHGVPRRGMSDGALVCPHCQTVCVPSALFSAITESEMQQVIGSSGRLLYEGTQEQCEAWVAAGNVAGSYSIERKTNDVVERGAIERELQAAMGLASCRGDEDRIDEALAELRGLRQEVAAWRGRFPEFTYRPQDECVALR